MKKKHDLLGFLLAIVTGVALLAAILVRTFMPRVILPKPNAILITALVLLALVLEHYLIRNRRRDFRVVPLYAAVIFGLFPFAACITAPLDALILAVMGAVICTVVTFLFDNMLERLSSGPAAKVAPAICAVGLFLAVQCLMGII